jgi:hypothetical protein
MGSEYEYFAQVWSNETMDAPTALWRTGRGVPEYQHPNTQPNLGRRIESTVGVAVPTASLMKSLAATTSGSPLG